MIVNLTFLIQHLLHICSVRGTWLGKGRYSTASLSTNHIQSLVGRGRRLFPLCVQRVYELSREVCCKIIFELTVEMEYQTHGVRNR